MGEAKRRKEAQEQILKETVDKLLEDGKIIEAEWVRYMTSELPPLPNNTLAVLHIAYMSGAQAAWTKIFEALEPGIDGTADLKTSAMSQINDEMNNWALGLAEAKGTA